MSTKILHGAPDPEDLFKGCKSLGEFCLNNFRSYDGNEMILVDAITCEEATGSQLLYHSVRIAECLTHCGIRAGDSVGICCENRIEYVYIVYGAILIGATVSPISNDFGPSMGELSHTCKLLQPKIIFASLSTVEKILNIADEFTLESDLIVIGGTDARHKTFASFLNNADVAETNVNTFECRPQNIAENVAVVLCSSGTTGLPKGVEITQRNLFSNLSIAFSDGSSDFHALIPSPMSYVSGFMTMFGALGLMYKTIILSKYTPDQYLSCIQKYKLPGMMFNPALMNYLAKSPDVDNYDLSTVKMIFYGAAPVSQTVIDAVRKRLNNVIILQFFAMTESCSIAVQSFTHRTDGSVGVLAKGVSGKVVDPASGELLGPNERGEIMFKSSRTMKGYRGNDEATKATFDADGFIHTGDIGYYNERGEWFVVDRLKELIKYYGNSISPASIEAVLVSHPCVRECCVVGLPDDAAIELPLAYVVKIGEVSEQELVDFVGERMSDQHRLRGGVRFIDEIPKNNSGSGKSFRRVLKEMVVKNKV